jgi:hypothetical protein
MESTDPARVITEIVTTDHGVIPSQPIGLSHGIQAALVVVGLPEMTMRFIIVNTFPVTIEAENIQALAERITRYLGQPAVVVFIIQDQPGRAELRFAVIPSDLRVQQWAAAAVATVKRNWGWDESQRFSFRFLDTGREIFVPQSVNGRDWIIESTG